ncbi:MAG: hypothetical protein HFF09_00685 [Oscillospiraceae bacterium]|nr:hypothetical protein [Oscillospiraceae bacterium]
MNKKSNIRSIRFNDELAALIDQQDGGNFTEKFTNLVTRCVGELPQKEAELKRLEERIAHKREQLRAMSEQAQQLSGTLISLSDKVREMERAVNRAVLQWKA